MSVSSMGGIVGVIAAANASAAALKQEELGAKYNSEDLTEWEFKIVRARFPIFSEIATIKNVEKREKENGWVLLEKFDNNRLRFKRLVSERVKDSQRKCDPYRIDYF